MAVLSTGRRCNPRGRRLSIEKVSLGRQFEARAASWFEQRGFRIICRNWRCPEGEIDLVVQRPGRDELIAVEVRYRRSPKYRPSLYLSERKKKRLDTTARRLSQQFGQAVSCELFEWLGQREGVQCQRFKVF